MSKYYTILLVFLFFVSVIAVSTSVKADDCVAPEVMSCTYDDGEGTVDATVNVQYAVNAGTTGDLMTVVFTGNCDATAVGVSVEVIDPTHDTTVLVSNGDGVCDVGNTDLCTAGTVGEACTANADCDTFTNVPDTNPCGEGDMKITADDFDDFCTPVTVSNGDGVCDVGNTDLCTAGTVGEACTADADCDTESVSSIVCEKLIEDIDVTACDEVIGLIAESSNLHDRQNEESKDCNGRRCKNDGDDKGHDRGKVLCTEVIPE